MERNKSKSKIYLIAGIALMVILLFIVATQFIYEFCYDEKCGDMVINFNDLKKVMSSDVIYLSNDFMEKERLGIVPISEIKLLDNSLEDISDMQVYEGDIYGEVYLEFNPNKVKFGKLQSVGRYYSENFKDRVKNIDLYRYELKSADGYDGIPVRVNICGAVGLVKDRSYDNDLPNGDSYAILDDRLTTYLTGKGKSYEVKGLVGKVGLIKKYSRLKITVTVDADKLENYTEDEIETRVNEVLSSALNYIER